MKKFYRVLLALMDDILLIAGMGCVTVAIWSVDSRCGLATLGAFLIIYSIIVARGKR